MARKCIGRYLEHLVEHFIAPAGPVRAGGQACSLMHSLGILESSLLRFTHWRANGHRNDHIVWRLAQQRVAPLGGSGSEMRDNLFDTVDRHVGVCRRRLRVQRQSWGRRGEGREGQPGSDELCTVQPEGAVAEVRR